MHENPVQIVHRVKYLVSVQGGQAALVSCSSVLGNNDGDGNPLR